MKEMPALCLQEKIQYYEQSRKSLPRCRNTSLPLVVTWIGRFIRTRFGGPLKEVPFQYYHYYFSRNLSFILWTVLCEKLHLTALVRITDCKTFRGLSKSFYVWIMQSSTNGHVTIVCLATKHLKKKVRFELALFSYKLLLCCLWKIVSGCDHFKVNPNLVFIRRLGHISQNCESSPWREGSISFGNLVMASDLVRTLYFM